MTRQTIILCILSIFLLFSSCSSDSDPDSKGCYIELITSRSILHGALSLSFSPNDEGKRIWIDIDDNHILDDDELLTEIEKMDTEYGEVYLVGAFTPRIRIYGEVTSLTCVNCNLFAIDISHNKYLKELVCSVNSINRLDISKNKQLTTLYCDRNCISTLDIGQNTELKTLSCSENHLDSLDVSKNIQLYQLNCMFNPMQKIKVNLNQLYSIPSTWYKDDDAQYYVEQ